MRQIIFTLFCLLVINLSASFGQARVTGTVLDQDEAPIIGAVVTVSGETGEKNTITDLDGIFEFTNLDGTYDKLIIHSLGFKNYEQALDASNIGTPFTITLKTDALLLQSVEVVGRARTDYISDYSFFFNYRML